MWKKIVTAALKIVEEKKRVISKPVSEVKGSHPRQIVDADESD